MIFNSSMNALVLNAVDEIFSFGSLSAPRKLEQIEIIGTTRILQFPRNRIFSIPARHTDLFYAFGEFLWYLSGYNDLDYIQYYAPSIGRFSDDGMTLNSGYGYRIFSEFGDQFEEVYQILIADPDSRQAIIMIRSPSDIFLKTKDQICTCCLQFFIRDNQLHLVTYMRSNDLMVGTLYDIFCFTMFQEFLALRLNVQLGYYYHSVGSLHIYMNDKWTPVIESIKSSLPVNNPIEMSPMTFINPNDTKNEIYMILQCEEALRLCQDTGLLQDLVVEINSESFTDYWKDILIFLAIKKAQKLDEPILIKEFKNKFSINSFFREV